MKYCHNCGTQMQDTDIFCSSCGYSHTVAPVHKENTNALLSMILGIISFFVGGLFLSIPAIILAKASTKESGGEMIAQAKAGFICGIISTIMHVLLFFLIIFIYILMFIPLLFI